MTLERWVVVGQLHREPLACVRVAKLLTPNNPRNDLSREIYVGEVNPDKKSPLMG
jgi:hypothetical protein